MRKSRIVYIILLSIIIVVSAVLSIWGTDLNIRDFRQYIPVVVFVISLALLIAVVINIKKEKEMNALHTRLSMWNSITYKVKKAGETAFNKLPIGIIVLDDYYKIVWANQTARSIFMSPLEHIYLNDLALPLYSKLNELKKDLFDVDENTKITYNADVYGKIYYVEYLIKNKIMYLTDITNFEKLQTRYYNRTEVLGYINIDNLEESLQELDVQTKAEYEGKIMGAIAKWATENGIFVRALTSTRYILITDQEHLEKLIKTNFSILDDVKRLFNTSRVIRVTLSIGITCSDVNVNDLSEDA